MTANPTSEDIEFARLTQLSALRRIVRNLTLDLPEKVIPGETASEFEEIETALTGWASPLPDSVILTARRQTKTARHNGPARTKPFHARTQKALGRLCTRLLIARGSIKPQHDAAVRDASGIELLAYQGFIAAMMVRVPDRHRDVLIDAYFDAALIERSLPRERVSLEDRVHYDAVVDQLIFWQDFLGRTGGFKNYQGKYRDQVDQQGLNGATGPWG